MGPISADLCFSTICEDAEDCDACVNEPPATCGYGRARFCSHRDDLECGQACVEFVSRPSGTEMAAHESYLSHFQHQVLKRLET